MILKPDYTFIFTETLEPLHINFYGTIITYEFKTIGDLLSEKDNIISDLKKMASLLKGRWDESGIYVTSNGCRLEKTGNGIKVTTKRTINKFPDLHELNNRLFNYMLVKIYSVIYMIKKVHRRTNPKKLNKAILKHNDYDLSKYYSSDAYPYKLVLGDSVLIPYSDSKEVKDYLSTILERCFIVITEKLKPSGERLHLNIQYNCTVGIFNLSIKVTHGCDDQFVEILTHYRDPYTGKTYGGITLLDISKDSLYKLMNTRAQLL